MNDWLFNNAYLCGYYFDAIRYTFFMLTHNDVYILKIDCRAILHFKLYIRRLTKSYIILYIRIYLHCTAYTL